MQWPGSVDTLKAYRGSLTGIVALAADDERALAQQWREGNARAGERLIEASLPFVIAIAAEYRRWGVPLEDLIQQGNLGLLKGAMRYDPDRDCRLITYAVYWIRAEIRDYVVNSYRVVRIGGSKGSRRTLRTFRRTREEDPVALAALAGVSVARAEQMLPLLKQRDVSLDAAVDGESPAVDRLRDSAPSPEEQTIQRADGAWKHRRVALALGRLSERERWIVERRVLADEQVTLEHLGQVLGISKERVRQIEARAFEKLRNVLGDVAA